MKPQKVLVEQLRDIELQRDALHGALKTLLNYQEHQSKDNQKRNRKVATERGRALFPLATHAPQARCPNEP